MPKKRSLSGISVNIPKNGDNNNTDSGDTNIVLPVVSIALSSTNPQNENSKSIRGFEYLVNSDDCKPWKYHNRDQIWMSPEKCKDLISSIRKNGQKFPIIARKIENDPEGKIWEIIAGRRRWFACKHIGIQVRLKAIAANDRDCAILMNLENKDRDDLSEFEDAVSYRQQLEAGLFDSQDDMAVALDLNKSKLSKMLNAAKLTNYNDVMRLFDDVTVLKINPVYKLVTAIERNSTNQEVIFQKARDLIKTSAKLKTKLSTTTIINKLLQVLDNSIKTSASEPKYFKQNDKTIIKTHKLISGRIIFEFNEKNSSEIGLEELKAITEQALAENFI